LKRFTLVFAVLLLLAGLTAWYLPASAQKVPRRVEVVVNMLSDSPEDRGFSRITFYMEEEGYNIERQVVTKSSGGFYWYWTNLDENGRLMRLTRESGGSYGGYYKYIIERAQNYQDYIYRFGKNGAWLEARVYPPNENAHANYQKNTDTCKNCHSTHYAQTSQLLNSSLVFELCMTCHDGSNSKYNILAGSVIVPGGAAVPAPAGPYSSAVATSYHNVFREGTDTVLLAPGGEKTGLKCTDCHSAHVLQDQTKPVRSSSFRLLKYFRQMIPGGSVYDQPPVIAYSFITASSYETVYISGINEFCSECHERYNYGQNLNPKLPHYPTHTLRTGSSGGIQKSGDYYRHPTGINIAEWLKVPISLPLEDRGTGGKFMTCKTCHYAHGTAIMQGYHYDFERDKYDQTGAPLTRSTMLKRCEGMGICLECHLDIWYNTPGAPIQ